MWPTSGLFALGLGNVAPHSCPLLLSLGLLLKILVAVGVIQSHRTRSSMLVQGQQTGVRPLEDLVPLVTARANQ